MLLVLASPCPFLFSTPLALWALVLSVLLSSLGELALCQGTALAPPSFLILRPPLWCGVIAAAGCQGLKLCVKAQHFLPR